MGAQWKICDRISKNGNDYRDGKHNVELCINCARDSGKFSAVAINLR